MKVSELIKLVKVGDEIEFKIMGAVKNIAEDRWIDIDIACGSTLNTLFIGTEIELISHIKKEDLVKIYSGKDARGKLKAGMKVMVKDITDDIVIGQIDYICDRFFVVKFNEENVHEENKGTTIDTWVENPVFRYDIDDFEVTILE